MQRIILSTLLLFLTIAHLSAAAPDNSPAACPLVKIEVQQLPPMNVPRTGHHALLLGDGELTVFGGHTTGFIPTPTAEYLRDGEWHQLPMLYPHDNATAVLLSSGSVLLAGGHEKNLGVGQTWESEMYYPDEHCFEAFDCMFTKRALATSLELDSGRVVISGNHYANDNTELFDCRSHRFLSPTPVTSYRCTPYIFPTSDGDVIIVSNFDEHDLPHDTIWADRLRGKPFRVPLLETWRLLSAQQNGGTDGCRISDGPRQGTPSASQLGAYLMPASDDSGQLAFVQVQDTVFTLLPTDCPVPMVSPWDSIVYGAPIVADRQARRAYTVGINKNGNVQNDKQRLYVLCVDYAQQPAHLTLYYTDPLDSCPITSTTTLLDDGNLVVTGGNLQNSNFSPTDGVWLLQVNGQAATASAHGSGLWLWGLFAVGMLALLGIGILFVRLKRDTDGHEHQGTNSEKMETDELGPALATNEDGRQSPSMAAEDSLCSSVDSSSKDTTEELMESIRHLMEEERLFLDSELKVLDIAHHLGIHRNQVSECINTQTGYTFAQFVAIYRTNYAKQLLHEHPDLKVSSIWRESGFANETSFFRTFKTLTGKTPNEWRAQLT